MLRWRWLGSGRLVKIRIGDCSYMPYERHRDEELLAIIRFSEYLKLEESLRLGK